MPAQNIQTPSGAVVQVNTDWFIGVTTFFMAMLAAGTPLSYAQGEAVNQLMTKTMAEILTLIPSASGIPPFREVAATGTDTVAGIPPGATLVGIAMHSQLYRPGDFYQDGQQATLTNGDLFTSSALLLFIPTPPTTLPSDTEPNPGT